MVCWGVGMRGPRAGGAGSGSCEVWLRRCATLPCPLGHSTIAVPGLSFRVRNGTGRLPWAMAAAKSVILSAGGGFGNRIVDASEGLGVRAAVMPPGFSGFVMVVLVVFDR